MEKLELSMARLRQNVDELDEVLIATVVADGLINLDVISQFFFIIAMYFLCPVKRTCM